MLIRQVKETVWLNAKEWHWQQKALAIHGKWNQTKKNKNHDAACQSSDEWRTGLKRKQI